MAKSEQVQILEQLKAGKLTVEQADRLLRAPVREKTRPLSAPTHIYVQVAEGGQKKTNIKLPLSLVKAGLKFDKAFGILGSRYDVNSPVVQSAMAAMRDVDIDQLLAAAKRGEIPLPHHLVDLDDSQEGKPSMRVAVVLK